MKTNYHPRSRRSKKPVLLIVLGVFIAGAITFSVFDRVLLTAASPLWQGRNTAVKSLEIFFGMFASKGALVAENEALRHRVAQLEAENVSGRVSVSREETLLRSLGRVTEGRDVAAAVLSRPPDTPYDVIIIDAGEREGIQVGQRVSLPEGGLLGHVEEVLLRSSRIRLFSSSGEKTNAVLERGELPVILEGYGGGSFRVVLPRDTLVQVGDRLLSPYIEAGLVAIVESVELRPTDSYKEVLARSPANIQMIRFVVVRQ